MRVDISHKRDFYFFVSYDHLLTADENHDDMSGTATGLSNCDRSPNTASIVLFVVSSLLLAVCVAYVIFHFVRGN